MFWPHTRWVKKLTTVKQACCGTSVGAVLFSVYSAGRTGFMKSIVSGFTDADATCTTFNRLTHNTCTNGKWFPIYRALESVSIVSALSTALTIHPRPIRVHQTLTVLNSNFLQLGRRSGGRPQQTVYPRQLPVNCETHYIGRHRTHNLPIC